MKSLSLLLLSFFLLHFCFGQPNINDSTITISAQRVTMEGNPKFLCSILTYNLNSHNVIMVGNVCLKTDSLEFEKANKVIYNPQSRKLVIFDCPQIVISKIYILKSKQYDLSIPK